jgi:oxygen-independent coproporphyrinogen III oxidase
MAGLYLHIPFCRQACHYCDFHFSTTLKSKGELTDALCRELELRKTETDGKISSIYFGGGTPSLLNEYELLQLFDTIQRNYEVESGIEITLEANPDDLNKDFLRMLKRTPVNRLSIGIQSFRDSDLQFMNRAHNSSEAIQSVLDAADAGFHNLTIDLIYAVPGMKTDDWIQNVEQALELPVQHLSAYCLTVEEGTALAYKISKGLSENVNDEEAEKHFRILLQMTNAAGMPWYEVSNFAKPGFEAKHNSSYWSGVSYLGIGPSAHSFRGNERSWNVSSNQGYIRAIREGINFREKEELSPAQQINEKILTGLRTRKGLTLSDIRSINEERAESVLELAHRYPDSRKLQIQGDTLFLTEDGLLFADAIAAHFFV